VVQFSEWLAARSQTTRGCAAAFEWQNYGKGTLDARPGIENVAIELQAFFGTGRLPDWIWEGSHGEKRARALRRQLHILRLSSAGAAKLDSSGIPLVEVWP
jgi:hypothetical protein